MDRLELVVDNWNPVQRQRIIKKLPGIWRNKGDRKVIAVRYSVRSRFQQDNRTFYLIRKEHDNDETTLAERFVVHPTSADSVIDFYRSLLREPIIHA